MALGRAAGRDGASRGALHASCQAIYPVQADCPGTAETAGLGHPAGRELVGSARARELRLAAEAIPCHSRRPPAPVDPQQDRRSRACGLDSNPGRGRHSGQRRKALLEFEIGRRQLHRAAQLKATGCASSRRGRHGDGGCAKRQRVSVRSCWWRRRWLRPSRNRSLRPRCASMPPPCRAAAPRDPRLRPGSPRRRVTRHRATRHRAIRRRIIRPRAIRPRRSRPPAAARDPTPRKPIRTHSRPALQFQGGAAGLFAGWPFTRPGSPGRFGGNHAKHQYGGFIGWFGPVFWPYAYDDIFAYAFWPFDSFDYGEAFWAFAYDDLFEGIFWADAEPETAPGEVVATAEADIPGSGDRSRAGVLGLEGQSREFAQICGDRTPGLSQWPILRIAQSVGLTREQRTALKDLQTAAAEAARVLKSACPVETPTAPVGRLDAMQERVQAMLDAIDLVRPGLEHF